jgi:hypothetical protein
MEIARLAVPEMLWSTSGEIETTEEEDPTVGVPGPVGGSVIDDCRPEGVSRPIARIGLMM